MAPEKPVASAGGAKDADMVKAFQELAQGERTAAALENQLSSMEAKIEALLAEAERNQREMQAKPTDEKRSGTQGSSTGGGS